MKEKVEPMHKNYFGKETPVPLLGYPDIGAGYYSRMLTYKNWFEFNCAQRVHQNNVEHLAWTLPLVFVNGIFFPRMTAGLCGVVFVGRELYRIGYMSKDGPNSKIREIGAIPLNVSELFLTLSVVFCLLRYQFGGFVSRRRIVQYFSKSHMDKQLEKMQDDFVRGRNIKKV